MRCNRSVAGSQPALRCACIRHAVMYRTTTFGTRSDSGRRFVERTLAVFATLNLQKSNVLDSLAEAPRAHHNGTTPP